MSYSTYFSGRIKLSKPLSGMAKWLFDKCNEAGYEKNRPEDMPDCDSPWQLSADSMFIEPVNDGRAGDWYDWLTFLLKIVAREGATAEGCVIWDGEETTDSGAIFVKGTRFKAVSVEEIPEPDWANG